MHQNLHDTSLRRKKIYPRVDNFQDLFVIIGKDNVITILGVRFNTKVLVRLGHEAYSKD